MLWIVGFTDTTTGWAPTFTEPQLGTSQVIYQLRLGLAVIRRNASTLQAPALMEEWVFLEPTLIPSGSDLDAFCGANYVMPVLS